ncbi:MAG: pilus assembly protein TadG-related protein [Kiloniellales bacterium]
MATKLSRLLSPRLVSPRLLSLGRSLYSDRRGGVLIYAAFALPLVLGAAGLSVDVGLWYAEKRIVQGAADAGAMAGALEIMRSGAFANIQAAALNDASQNGYDPAAGDSLEFRSPPSSGISAGTTDAVEVIVRRPAPVFFSGMFYSGTTMVTGRAVAAADLDDTCVYALNPNARGAVKVNGGANISLACGIKVASTDSAAVDQTSAGSCLSSTLIKIKDPGWYDGTCVNAAEGIHTTAAVQDPMAGVAPPVDASSLSCDHTAKVKVNNTQSRTINPGTYCAGIEIEGSGTLTLNPGLYILHRAGLKVSAQGTLQGEGVTFYITPDARTSDSINFQAGATVDLSAPDVGQAGMPGVLFYQDRNVSSSVSHSLTAGSNMNLEGTLYFPTSDVNFAGGASLSATAAQLIADTVSFAGQSSIGQFEGSVIEANSALVTARLLE